MEKNKRDNIEFIFVLIIRGVFLLLGVSLFVVDVAFNKINPPISMPIYGIIGAVSIFGDKIIDAINNFKNNGKKN